MKEVVSVDNVLMVFKDKVVNVWVDVLKDNKVVVEVWINKMGKSLGFNIVLKKLFFIFMVFNVLFLYDVCLY